MTPGTYILARDLTCPGGAIRVTANNVNLVLAGHTLTAAPIVPNGVFAQNVTGLKITGGTIVGFGSAGIALDNPPNVRVTGVTVTTSGISLNAGIIVSSTTGALLSGNTVTNNASIGISLLFFTDSNRVVGTR
jgi:parallel beta-helix repeat protein